MSLHRNVITAQNKKGAVTIRRKDGELYVFVPDEYYTFPQGFLVYPDGSAIWLIWNYTYRYTSLWEQEDKFVKYEEKLVTRRLGDYFQSAHPIWTVVVDEVSDNDFLSRIIRIIGQMRELRSFKPVSFRPANFFTPDGPTADEIMIDAGGVTVVYADEDLPNISNMEELEIISFVFEANMLKFFLMGVDSMDRLYWVKLNQKQKERQNEK